MHVSIAAKICTLGLRVNKVIEDLAVQLPHLLAIVEPMLSRSPSVIQQVIHGAKIQEFDNI